jgi:hypothetical protein
VGLGTLRRGTQSLTQALHHHEGELREVAGGPAGAGETGDAATRLEYPGGRAGPDHSGRDEGAPVRTDSGLVPETAEAPTKSSGRRVASVQSGGRGLAGCAAAPASGRNGAPSLGRSSSANFRKPVGGCSMRPRPVSILGKCPSALNHRSGPPTWPSGPLAKSGGAPRSSRLCLLSAVSCQWSSPSCFASVTAGARSVCVILHPTKFAACGGGASWTNET